MSAYWLYFLLKYFTLSLLFQIGEFKNISLIDEKSLGPNSRRSPNSRVSKDRLWDFLRLGDYNSRKIKPTKIQPLGHLNSRKLLEVSNVSLEDRVEDLLFIRDLDNLFTMENSSSWKNNITLDYDSVLEPHITVAQLSNSTNFETEYFNINQNNDTLRNITLFVISVNESNIFKQTVQNDRYLSKFTIGEGGTTLFKDDTEVVDSESSNMQNGKLEADWWPVKLSAEVPGDVILGGLMMVHEREDSVTCGPIMPQGGIQALETMLYTLDVINSQPQRPFTLGAHILDDCDKDTYGLEMAVDFIKGNVLFSSCSMCNVEIT